MKLYSGKEKIFPEIISINGENFEINADFRNILRIFSMIKDRNISDLKKCLKLREYFIRDSDCLEMVEIIEAFSDFVALEGTANQRYNGENIETDKEQQFCYEFDGEEIYSSFLSEYKLDLIECSFLHWYKFKIMLASLSEASIFKKKIALRFMDLSSISRELPEFSSILQARESVQLPYENDSAEELDMRGFEEFWERV